jgi:transcriptional regulator with XRE-family HTH domain
MDDARLGAAFRALRIRRGWRQTDLARRVRVSRGVVSRVERGHIDELHVDDLRRLARELDGSVDVVLRWRAGDLDRLVNSRHAALHEAFARTTGRTPGWVFAPEVSFAIYGERGVVDVLGWHASTGTVLVVELKTELVDLQEHLGTLDRKTRLARQIAAQRGWRAATVGTWLVVASGRTNRRRIDAHAALLRSALLAGGREANAWLRSPAGPLRALSQVSYARDADLNLRIAARKRVRIPAQAAAHGAASADGRTSRSPARSGSGARPPLGG